MNAEVTAIIGTGGIGSVIARQLASGGETLRLSSADQEEVGGDLHDLVVGPAQARSLIDGP